jgi:pimeloyl-ACP methyl ester carboxylesterase
MPKLLAAVLVAVLAVPPSAGRALEYLEGEVGPGTTYGIWVPDAWNGDLVLYAHGFRNPNCPLAVPTTPGAFCITGDSGTPQAVRPMRDALLARGYAFAASSYSGTALALKEGAFQTFQLKKLFGARVAPPRRTFLYGHSMGGAIVAKLAEQHPGEFDGALAACGMIAGSPTQFRYVADARAVFDVLFPGVVPGGVAAVPEGLTFYGDVMPAVMSRFSGPDAPANLARAMGWARIDQVAYPFADYGNLVKGLLEFLYFQTLGTPGVLDATHGIPVDNRDVVYSGPPVLALLGVDLARVNAEAERVAADPQAVQAAEHFYDSTGALTIPLMTLHTLRDAAVPVVHERVYREKAEAAGRASLLVQRTVDHGATDGHCTFSLEEELSAFGDLVTWSETGARPAGDPAP